MNIFLAEQLEAAEAEARAWIRRLASELGEQVQPWPFRFALALETEAHQRAARRDRFACPHPMSTPRVLVYPGFDRRLTCLACARLTADPGDRTCDDCGAVEQALTTTWAVLGPLILVYKLCTDCERQEFRFGAA